MPAANIIQLRQLLADKFPGLRTRLDETPAAARDCWPTGLRSVDEALQGGLNKGTLVEIVSPTPSSGSATLLRALLEQAAAEKQIIALIDGGDSLDVTALPPMALSRLLWIRCRSAEEAMKAADLLLRDGNLSLVLIDLALNPAAQLRRIPATTWYRFQRLVEETTTICAIFTPRILVGSAQSRITLQAGFSLTTLEAAAPTQELQIEFADARQFRGVAGQSFT